MSAPTLRPMSVDEYLRCEETTSFKREYVGGFVYPVHGNTRAQAGATVGHVRIGLNIFSALDAAAMAHGCKVFNSDMKLRPATTDNFYCPDSMMVCGRDGGQFDPGAVFHTDSD